MNRSLRVMIDARMLIGAFGGIARYVTRLIDELAAQDGIHVLALCGDGGCARLPMSENVSVVKSDFGRRDRSALRRLSWEKAHLPQLIRQSSADIYHATWNSGIPARCPVPAILTIHDLIPMHDPPSYFDTRRDRWAYEYSTYASTRRAERIATVSEHVRRDVLNSLRVHPDRVITVHNGVDKPASSVPRAQTPYVLCVGGFERRKNVTAVFTAMRRYWERFDRGLELRLTGDKKQLDAADLSQLPDDAPIRFLGDIDDDDLSAQYTSARLLLTLSRDEGFGLPVLEAMAHRCPVVAASMSSLPEVVGDAGFLVHPDDPDATVGAVRRVHTDASLRTDLIQRGIARVRLFGWDRTARHMRDIYESVLMQKPARETFPASHATAEAVC